jgi:spermidine synthase
MRQDRHSSLPGVEKNRPALRLAGTAPAPERSAALGAGGERSKAWRTILYILFAVSGFAGLIYESIWTHYLKLFLGHAAYAQTLVVAIFMGGMALGSCLAARWSGRFTNLLAGYALTEAAVAACALLFHEAFVASTAWAQDSVLPHFGGFKWVLSTALILPQCVLLGMTFPLMTAGVLRSHQQRPGRTISVLYFTNSLGAAVGVLMSGFVLVPAVGLAGTVRFAGGLNLAVAGAVSLLARRPPAPIMRTLPPSEEGYDRAIRFFLAVALLTGASSFIYEVAWIRMLALVLGASTHAFELMLSAFILGLALGGSWIQGRIDRLRAPLRTLAFLQIAMGLLALCTLPIYGKTFELMRWLVTNLDRTGSGYGWFVLSSNGIALAVMLPATFCAGTTLPLITFQLMKGGYGEPSIGAVYAANTVGAITAVFFAVHVGLPALGLKGLLVLGAAIDIALGLVLLWRVLRGLGRTRLLLAWMASGAAAVSMMVLFVQLDPYRMASGVYRAGKLLQIGHDEILFHRDGKTATVDVVRHRDLNVAEILTNGKSDAAIAVEPRVEPSTDEPTMILLGALPMALYPQARTVACIGFGSGLTSHTLLANPRFSRVDTIEIEPEMVRGAQSFRPANERAYSDPRSRIIIDDAKTYFATQREKYDMILSEPSNPWVSGVAGLFSDEFYRLVRRHLVDGGLFAQWLQLYEIDVPLVVSVLKALDANFSDYVVYASTGYDLLIFAANGGAVRPLEPRMLGNPRIAEPLARIGVRSTQDLEARLVGTRKSWEGLTRSFAVPVNSDYAPVLDQNAARTMFLRADAHALTLFQKTPFPAVELLSGMRRSRGTTDVAIERTFENGRRSVEAMYLFDVLLKRVDANEVRFVASDDLHEDARKVSRWLGTCGTPPFASLVRVLQRSLADLSSDEADAIFRSIDSGRCGDGFRPFERDWLGLLHAVGRRDAPGMVAAAGQVLVEERELSAPSVHYAVAAGMLGALAQGDMTGAREIWVRYGQSIPVTDDLLLRALVARAEVQ